MATLDFSELDKDPPGESFEGLIRLLGQRLGLIVRWSGRGADGGRDLIFIETQRGPLSATPLRWLVSCKDNSGSGSSVLERDAGSVLDKVSQHKCDGFLLATTTTASTGLKEKLDQLDVSHGGTIQTKVWDRFELTALLLEDRCADLLAQFFPRHVAQRAKLALDEAREVVERALPRFAVAAIRQYLVSYEERSKQISGLTVWPHDADQIEAIDKIAAELRFNKFQDAAAKLEQLHFDAFVVLVDRLIRNFPDQARSVLKEVARVSTDSGVLYNVIEALREDPDFGLEEELEITRRFDYETLHELYHDLTKEMLEEKNVWNWRLPTDALLHDDHVELESVSVHDLEFSGGDAVSVAGRVRLTVNGWTVVPERDNAGTATFDHWFAGYWLPDGIEIEKIK
jgi:hypothetical protein